MYRADAEMKPEITAWDRKFAIHPVRRRPSRNRKIPDRTASRAAAVDQAMSWLAVASASAVAVIREMTATGPTASMRELPKQA